MDNLALRKQSLKNRIEDLEYELESKQYELFNMEKELQILEELENDEELIEYDISKEEAYQENMAFQDNL